MNCFIAGTDTGVGKTHITKILLEELRANGIDAVGYKPIVCGDRTDAELLATASGGISIDEINPLWLKTAAAPWIAAQLENRSIDIEPLLAGYHALAAKHELVLVEGVGGWEVPLTADYSSANLAKDLGLPVALVIANRLGAINHSVLSVQSMRARDVPIVGLIFNHLEDELDTAMIANKHCIPTLTGLPILCEVIHSQDWIDSDWLSDA